MLKKILKNKLHYALGISAIHIIQILNLGFLFLKDTKDSYLICTAICYSGFLISVAIISLGYFLKEKESDEATVK